MMPASAPAALVIEGDAAVRASIQRLAEEFGCIAIRQAYVQSHAVVGRTSFWPSFLRQSVPKLNDLRWYGTRTDIEDRKPAEEALRQSQSDLAHISRVTTMGELTASLAHEVNQPIAAAITNANSCLR